MTEKEKLELAISRGYTYDSESGNVYGIKGKQITSKSGPGYLQFALYLDSKKIMIKCHRFGWYYYKKEIPNIIDHINRIKDDNRLVNLRSVTLSQNQFNRGAKGYRLDKRTNKYESYIRFNGKRIHLGTYDEETKASEAYQRAKTKYHLIK